MFILNYSRWGKQIVLSTELKRINLIKGLLIKYLGPFILLKQSRGKGER